MSIVRTSITSVFYPAGVIKCEEDDDIQIIVQEQSQEEEPLNHHVNNNNNNETNPIDEIQINQAFGVGVDEVPLNDEKDLQVYEELLMRMRNEVLIKDFIASREVVDKSKTKINVILDDGETNCQALCLRGDLAGTSSAWESFNYPRDFGEFLETLHSWANNYLNNHLWPQEDITKRLKIIPYKLHHDSLKSYVETELNYLLNGFYDRIKQSVTESSNSKTTEATISDLDIQDQWTQVKLRLDKNNINLDFGRCCVLVVKESHHLMLKRKYLATILGKSFEELSGKRWTIITLKAFEFTPFIGDQVELISLFRINNIYLSGSVLMELDKLELNSHLFNPTLQSSSSGIDFDFAKKRFSSFECDCIQKALDTIALPSDSVSPFCCLDFREQSIDTDALCYIACELLLQMRKAREIILTMNPCLKGKKKFQAVLVCNDDETAAKLDKQLCDSKFAVYRIYRKEIPEEVEKEYTRIAKKLTESLSVVQELDDVDIIKKLAVDWSLVVEGIFESFEQEQKYQEMLDLAKVFALRNSDIILGSLCDMYNDKIFNSSFCNIFACIIMGASTLPECFILPLLKFGCEKFILIDRVPESKWHNRALFARLLGLFDQEWMPSKGSKCSIVTGVKKKMQIPEPPKDSRHALIDKNKRDWKPKPGYNPEQRKNPRNRLPYCPKAAQSGSSRD